MINVLKDFEEYISCARNGGTIGKMRDPKQNKDEDIRATIVQQVIFSKFLTFLFFSSSKKLERSSRRRFGPSL